MYEKINETTYKIDGTIIAVNVGLFDGMNEQDIADRLREIYREAAI